MCAAIRIEGFIRVSQAIDCLAAGMWGGRPRPIPLAELKKHWKKVSVGFAPWREQAARNLRSAIERDELPLYVMSDPASSADDDPHTLYDIPMHVPASVVERLVGARGVLSDHPIRTTFKTVGGDDQLLERLRFGALVVREKDFDAWYRSERGKGQWPSLRSRRKNAIGRPPKQRDAIRNAILGAIYEGRWSAQESIAQLDRLLRGAGRDDVPSADTLARTIDQLHRETGEPKLLRKRRPARPTGC